MAVQLAPQLLPHPLHHVALHAGAGTCRRLEEQMRKGECHAAGQARAGRLPYRLPAAWGQSHLTRFRKSSSSSMPETALLTESSTAGRHTCVMLAVVMVGVGA